MAKRFKPKGTVDDFSEVDAQEGFANYSGPVPPRGSYRCKLKHVKIGETKSSHVPAYKALFEIEEPKGSKKAQYNGYAIWPQQMLTEKSAPYTNAFLDAMKIPRQAAWQQKIMVADDGETCEKIGSWVFKDGIYLDINCKYTPANEEKGWEARLEPVSYASAKAAAKATDGTEDDPWATDGEDGSDDGDKGQDDDSDTDDEGDEPPF